ncbi:DUF3618 domain-containing protein [Streptomyces chumphonensis]|uniref:DUF3618 domain-containing protein n=1 Tax=Streptomyces chumphonensis TaxID=1214925 RepID=A0A927IA88_9ACTN|nr:DUF3618 domain-containing protein [Streptomyces chumphonensis]MBD3930898.1 DUF3618 domain-containing protein [Streptomyces chumphonensis]
MPDRTPAQIEADIVRRREQLAATLDEIAVRVHPKTIADGARARAAAAVDRTAGRAYLAANRAVGSVRDQLVTEDGAPRLARVVPLALVTVAVAGLYLSSRRRHR